MLLSQKLEVVATGEFEQPGFRRQVLENADVVTQVLRPNDLVEHRGRLGEPSVDLVFFPVPLPCLGGSGNLHTYDRGGIWEHLAIVAHSLGLDPPSHAARLLSPPWRRIIEGGWAVTVGYEDHENGGRDSR